MNNNTSNHNRSELTIFLFQLSSFLIPLGLIVPFFLSPGFGTIVLKGEILAYFSNLFTGTYGLWFSALVVGSGALALALLRLIFRKYVKRYCETKTTLLSFAIGAFGAASLYCIATMIIGMLTSGDLSRHPLQISWGFVYGLLFSLTVMLLIGAYLFLRIEKRSFLGLIFDLPTALLTFFVISPLGSVAFGILSDLAHFLEW